MTCTDWCTTPWSLLCTVSAFSFLSSRNRRLRANLFQLLQQHLLCFHWSQLHFLYVALCPSPHLVHGRVPPAARGPAASTRHPHADDPAARPGACAALRQLPLQRLLRRPSSPLSRSSGATSRFPRSDFSTASSSRSDSSRRRTRTI